VAGNRGKRACLALFGRRAVRYADARGLTGCDWLVGISNQRRDSGNWLSHLGKCGSVEIYCHPGYRDESLVGRDCNANELDRRSHELHLLRTPRFHDAIRRSGL